MDSSTKYTDSDVMDIDVNTAHEELSEDIYPEENDDEESNIVVDDESENVNENSTLQDGFINQNYGQGESIGNSEPQITENGEVLNKTKVENAYQRTLKHPTRLPLARIKNIMKMDPDVSIVSNDAVFLVTKATELFIEFLAKETNKQMASGKRKTVMKKDVDSVIGCIPHLCFLDGVFE